MLTCSLVAMLFPPLSKKTTNATLHILVFHYFKRHEQLHGYSRYSYSTGSESRSQMMGIVVRKPTTYSFLYRELQTTHVKMLFASSFLLYISISVYIYITETKT